VSLMLAALVSQWRTEGQGAVEKCPTASLAFAVWACCG